MDGLLASLTPAVWPVLISVLTVVATFLTTRHGQDGTARKNDDDTETGFRRDILQDNRELRERLSAAERRNDELLRQLEQLRAGAVPRPAPPVIGGEE